MYVVKRFHHNPIISPITDHPFEARAAFNGCPIIKDGIIHLLYRAIGKPDPLISSEMGMSTIGKALSLDGEHFQNRRQFISPEHDWEKYGCEDPRVTEFEGKNYIFYTAISSIPPNPGSIRVGLAISKDLEKIDEKHLITPFNAKAMALFPERIGKKIVAILTAHTDEPPAKIAIVECSRIEDLWNEEFWKNWHQRIDEYRINPLRFDSDHVEIGAPPIKTKWGWLVIYSYIQNYFGGGQRIFGIEAMLLDLKDPRVIIAKTKGPILVPEEIYERYGVTKDIVFPSGTLLHKNGKLDIYYGAADTTCAKASVDINDLVASFFHQSRPRLFERFEKNPIITPNESNEWESKATFNPGAIDMNGKVHILYRAMSKDNTSTLGYASSRNGCTISERSKKPAYIPREEFEMKKGSPDGNSGCEDPRLSLLDGKVYLTYTAFDGVRPTRVALSSINAKDFVAKKFDKWSKPIAITPENVDDKDMCFLPKKINGQYMLFHRINGQICADFLPNLEFTTDRITRCIEIISPRAGLWDSVKIGIAAPPLETKDGWLLIYHGVSRTLTYRLGAVLLDKKNPSIVLARSAGPIFEPVEDYEKIGQVPNVVFACGAVIRGDTLFIYYGGGDRVVGVAKTSVKEILSGLLPKSLKD